MAVPSFDRPYQDPKLGPVFDQVFSGRDLMERHCQALLATTDIYAVQRLALEAIPDTVVSYHRSFRAQFSGGTAESIEAETGALIESAGSHDVPIEAPPLTIDLHITADAASRVLCRAIERIRSTLAGAQVRALTLSHFAELAQRENLSYASLAATLAGAGLCSLLPSLIRGNAAPLLQALKACTLGFGIVSKVSPSDRIAKTRELLALRELSRTVEGIDEYAPVCAPPDQPEHSGFAELKTIAAARLLLRDASRITMLWGSTTWKMVQMSFAFGVNHIDGLPLGSLDQFLSNKGAPTPLEREVEHVITQAHRQPRAV